MSDARIPNPLVEQFRRGGVPRELRLLAAQGALPLKPIDLAELVHLLLGDSDPEVRAAADASLRSLPVAEFLPLLKDREAPVQVLGWALVERGERELREAALQNHSTPDEALAAVATTLSQEHAELVVINQTRLLRSTPLLEALEANAGLSNDQRRRLRELRETFQIGVAPAAEPEAPAAPVAAAEPEAALEPEPEAAEPPPPASEQEAVAQYLSEDERRDPEKLSAVQRLYRMTAAQKVIAALKGSREERAVLVRDPNRLVSTAVLGSPRVTDTEIESFAGMKNVSDEILRRIGSHREWVKRYPVVANLVKNPRTPLAIALPLVPRLNPRDLRGLSTDRNVPEVIRKHAQRFVRNADQSKR
jgi:hypothetical protein